MFHFYFTNAIPSITDWIQAIAGIAVFYTLYLQYKANKNQSKQLQISIVPKLRLSIREDEPFFDSHERDAGILTCECLRNNTYNLTFKFIDREDLVFELNGTSNLSDNEKIEKRFNYLREHELLYFMVNVNFEDMLSNKYSQVFKYWEGRFLSSAPQLQKK